ncbi:APC family permease [Myxococcus llanfairpwllgwyngyllgogerychwyrndrobwllllantysiliogogogochensis]|uniref:APC family permease n=2 Tax=Myxococcus llanfairpwllgwyngyllgogerychwyrndrobwllllantysiliogogogochensis TaxID=2590453 RepID=A0A540WL08_9BACT|nr:APC family permease [Myxococcus llanfairpwllgwyngyllgogerychwyrndrobwllllantysiliogogogochensis]
MDTLLGKPLTTAQASHEQVGVLAGVALLGLDALSSAAYGPEAALTVLRPLGPTGVKLLLPITACIVGLLVVVASSYRQTIAAYPRGGGAYTVARENLGRRVGLLAASALLLDYLLNVAVGISAGVGAIVSAFPALRPHTLGLALGLLGLLTLVNLRGAREAGALFLLPTVMFIGSLFILLAVGAFRAFAQGGAPASDIPPPALPSPSASVGLWLVLRAFASGCTAMTGVEAVSNAVPVFRAPSVRRARLTLSLIILTLVLLLLGVSALCQVYGVGATAPDGPGYQSVLSQLLAAVTGRGVFYYVAMTSILGVLALSANTSFAGFPRVCWLLALDRYLPVAFVHRGRRLAYSRGILLLAVLAGVLILASDAITDRLIPLFAIGALLAFTLSQTGMVVYWTRRREAGWRWRRVLNGVGALLTGLALAIVIVAKFTHGGWAAVVIIPLGVLLFSRVHKAYLRVRATTGLQRPMAVDSRGSMVAVVPMSRWSHASETALRFALGLCHDVRAVHVRTDEDEAAPGSLAEQWAALVQEPAVRARLQVPRLDEVPSPYRGLVQPLLDYVDGLLAEDPHRTVAVVLPELLERRWYRAVMYGRRSELLRSTLMLSGARRLVVISVPWYLRTEDQSQPGSALGPVGESGPVAPS